MLNIEHIFLLESAFIIVIRRISKKPTLFIILPWSKLENASIYYRFINFYESYY